MTCLIIGFLVNLHNYTWSYFLQSHVIMSSFHGKIINFPQTGLVLCNCEKDKEGGIFKNQVFPASLWHLCDGA